MNLTYTIHCYCCFAEFALWDDFYKHLVKSLHSMQNHIGEDYKSPCPDLTHK